MRAILRRVSIGALAIAAQLAVAGAQSAPGIQQPPRDSPAQKEKSGEPTAALRGRVLAADTGRPLRRAHVIATAAELPGGRGFVTDDNGEFELAALPAGRYTVTATLAGYVSLAYGQRRPLQPGIPIEVTSGQQIKGIEFRLPRGSVIGGRIFDDHGDPLVGATVRALRYQLVQGERRLFPAAVATTDDRGVFRMWGLNPGDYYVDAIARNLGLAGAPADAPPNGRGGAAGSTGEEQRSFAPTYYPGVTSPAQARPVTAGVGQERLDIDFGLDLVPVARVTGRLINPNGSPTSRGGVTLAPDTAIGGLAVSFAGAVRPDGTFDIANVPQGSYILQARGNDSATPDFARQPVFVDGTAVTGLQIILGRGAVVAGTVAFVGSSKAPTFSRVGVTAVPAEPSLVGAAIATADNDGDFIMTGVQPGYRLFRPAAEIPGWILQSVVVDGRDITDTPVQIAAGTSLDDVLVTFTDKASEIVGTLKTDRGEPITDYTVLAFPIDPSLWRPQSRHIQTARPDQYGAFRLKGLPAGTYFLSVVDPVEPGEWLDSGYLENHRAGATRVTVGEGESKTQDFRVAVR